MYNEIKDLIGKKYRQEYENRGEGLYDCWDIVLEIFKRKGIILPSWEICHSDAFVDAKIAEERTKTDFWIPVSSINPPIPSLIVFKQYGVCNHVGVYIGDGMFVHSGEKTGVTCDSINHILWKRRIEGYYTVKEG